MWDFLFSTTVGGVYTIVDCCKQEKNNSSQRIEDQQYLWLNAGYEINPDKKHWEWYLVFSSAFQGHTTQLMSRKSLYFT